MDRLFPISAVLVLAITTGCSDGNEEIKRSSAAMADASGTTLPSTSTTLPSSLGNPNDPTTGPGFFRLKVAANFSKDCSSCHASTSTIKAPLSIYDYFKAKKMLAAGASGASNEFIDRLTGVRAHGGGKICDVGAENTICRDLEGWYDIEVAQGTLNNFDSGVTTTTLPGQTTTTTTTTTLPGTPDPRSAGISSVSIVGLVNGWAVDKQNLNRQVTVTLVVGGLLGQGGQVVGENIIANRAGPDGNHPGDHRFEFQLGAAIADGTQRTLYVYDGNTLLLTTGFQFRAWAPSAEGRAFFEANVAGGLRAAGCGVGSGCHAFTYESAFPYLLDPPPVAGATAAGALLVTRPSMTGTSHGGGRRCNDANSGVCAAIQQWWNLEFR